MTAIVLATVATREELWQIDRENCRAKMSMVVMDVFAASPS